MVEAGNITSTDHVIVFVHGFPECWYSWKYVLPEIDPKYRTIALDMKGYGRSFVDAPVSVDQFDWHVVGREIVGMLQSIDIEKFYVATHDWGSIVGSVMVRDHAASGRILGFVRMELDLLDVDPRALSTYKNRGQILLFQSQWVAEQLLRNTLWLIDHVYRPRMTTSLADEDRKYLVYEFSRPEVRAAVPHYFSWRHWDWGAAITDICTNEFNFPVLQLQADSDPAQPVEAFAGAELVCPQVSLQWLRNSSHFSNLDRPHEVAAAINAFLP